MWTKQKLTKATDSMSLNSTYAMPLKRRVLLQMIRRTSRIFPTEEKNSSISRARHRWDNWKRLKKAKLKRVLLLVFWNIAWRKSYIATKKSWYLRAQKNRKKLREVIRSLRNWFKGCETWTNLTSITVGIWITDWSGTQIKGSLRALNGHYSDHHLNNGHILSVIQKVIWITDIF